MFKDDFLNTVIAVIVIGLLVANYFGVIQIPW